MGSNPPFNTDLCLEQGIQCMELALRFLAEVRRPAPVTFGRDQVKATEEKMRRKKEKDK